MSHPSNDQLASQAETQAIEEVLDKVSHNNPAFDRLVDIRADKILQELLSQPGPRG